MQGFGGELKISESVINSGMQIFKLATMNNFIQGRRMNMVAAVCLYTACRKEKPCKVMLIDFADSCGVCLSHPKSSLILHLTYYRSMFSSWVTASKPYMKR
jgi:transcription initiation factor TFIIIB Brf1 subunit/transcription initiation factor TFIIB